MGDPIIVGGRADARTPGANRGRTLMRSSRCGGWAAGTVVAVALVSLMGGRPASAESQKAAAIDLGQKLYTQYCASCHGADGKGNGPAAAKLDPKPTDLTQLAKRNGGKFPFYETMVSIEGRSPTAQQENTDLPGVAAAHGDPKMPVWGEVFSRDELSKGTSMDLQMQATGKIMMITEYLQSIQAK
jgi:mono/diheme cytochrome c family protein